ncbi:SDR family NAD(P)-dependent oxidoreductase [Agromyces atrinae]|nr:SDR family oxidoreductase [Agromyces atrinae]NYD67120.1 hypothetical protein [Agromyces atrinae]
MRDYTGTTAIVTGASAGLGVEFARALGGRGANLVLVARRGDRLETLAEELRDAHAVDVHTLALDLASPEATETLVAFVREKGLTIDSLINNAGFATHGEFITTDPARLDEEVRLNVGAVVAFTRAFLPEMTASGRGVLVNLASTAAFQPVPLMAVYGATKGFVLDFTHALAYETRHTGLRVTALCPGATKTEFFDIAGDGARVGDFAVPSEVVAVAMRALDARRTPSKIVAGAKNSISSAIARVLPRGLVTPVTARLMAE